MAKSNPKAEFSKKEQGVRAGRACMSSASLGESIQGFGLKQETPEEQYAQNHEDCNDDYFDKAHSKLPRSTNLNRKRGYSIGVY